MFSVGSLLVEEHGLGVFVGKELDVAQDVLLGDNAQDFSGKDGKKCSEPNDDRSYWMGV